MPTIYERWILGIGLRFPNNLSKRCQFADFNRPTLDISTNSQKKHSIGEQIFLVGMELLNNATIYDRWILGIGLRFPNNLSKMCSFADFNRLTLDICTNLQKKHWIGKQIIWVVIELLNKAHQIRPMDFSHLPQIWK